MLEKIKFDKFTAFEKLEVKFSPGINILVGENGTGKTHILKAAYAACDIATSKRGFAEKINNVFYPSEKQIGCLVKRSSVSSKGSL
ncbi:MAG: AAA family ATPase [Chlorobium sp.]